MMKTRTKTLTIMFTDIKGFTATTSTFSREQIDNLLSLQDSIIKPVIKKYKGIIIKTIGDAYMVTFESPTNAVLCGVKIQEAVRKHDQEDPDHQFEIRIGINSGEVNITDGDVFGEAVNIASRIESIAEPNEVYFTESVYLAMNKAEVPSVEIGVRRLKGIPDEIRVYKVLYEKNQIKEKIKARKKAAKEAGKLDKHKIYSNKQAASISDQLKKIQKLLNLKALWIGMGATALILLGFYFWDDVFGKDEKKEIPPEKREFLSEEQVIIKPAENGAYVGVFPGWGEFEDDVSADFLYELEAEIGNRFAFVPFSLSLERGLGVKKRLDEIDDYEGVPMIRLFPWGEPYWTAEYQSKYDLEKIIKGEFDDIFANWAEEIKEYEEPVMVTFAVEMNGDWFPWSGTFQGGNEKEDYGDPSLADGPEKYVDAYRHVVDLFDKEGVTNATWYFHPDSDSVPDKAWNDLEAYYPGDEYVDWVAVSLYGATSSEYAWMSFQDSFVDAYEKMTDLYPEKPFMIAEWGVGELPDQGDKGEWYREAFLALEEKFPKVKIAVSYSEQWEEENGAIVDLRINSSEEALTGFQDGIFSDYFLVEYIDN